MINFLNHKKIIDAEPLHYDGNEISVCNEFKEEFFGGRVGGQLGLEAQVLGEIEVDYSRVLVAAVVGLK